jgi:1-phosphofructokinase
MIYTLTMNPALDKTIIVNNFKIDSVNRVSQVRIDPGGKGINVSNMVKQLGGNSEAIVASGGATGNQLLELLEQKDIPYMAFDIGGDTRINTKVVDPEYKTFTDINEAGPLVAKEKINEIKEYLKQTLKAGDLLVLAGSLPKGVEASFYKDLVKIGNEVQAKVIVDADGKNLEESLLEGPFMIKPNEHELEMYFNESLETEEKLLGAAKKIVDKGISCVVISLGEKGSLAVTKDGASKIVALKLEVKSTVGAGDSMVAGIAYYLDNILEDKTQTITISELIKAVKLGVASSSASIEQEGTQMGSKNRVDVLLEQVTYQPI